MRLAGVDESATMGSTALNRADPVPKIVAFTLILAAVVTSTNVLVVAGIALTLAAVAVAVDLPWRSIFVLAAYPALFAAIFAWAATPDFLTGSLLVAKAVTSALAALLLMFSTPYPQVFAPVQRVMPGVVGDALLLTYRSFFLLLAAFSDLLRSARLRSGIVRGHPVRSTRAMAKALGGLVLYTFDLSQRTYEVMRIRGYEGGLKARIPHGRAPGIDAVVLTGAGLMTIAAAAWRVAWPALGPYSWTPMLVGLLALASALTLALVRSALQTRPSRGA
jgi:energy-coupling factor transporter transmembrane protein EcfT